jgi:hypothetical protein
MGFSLKKLAKGALKIGGAAIGGAIGGPAGAKIGGSLGSIAGGLIGSSGAKKSGAAAAAGMERGADYLQGQVGQLRTDYEPYVAAGRNALANLSDPNAFENSPGYQFAVDQGLDAVKTQANSLGRLASGNTLAALTDYNRVMAQQDYGNWWDRQSGVASMGLNATGNMSSIGANLGGNIANLFAGAGGAKAAGIQGAADAWGNTLSDLGGFLGLGSAPNGGPAAASGAPSANITDMGMDALDQPKKKINRLSLSTYGG